MLSNGTGLRTRTWIHDDQGKPTRETESHWYHVKVINLFRASPAHETRVMLLQADVLNASGLPKTRWSGAIQLSWRDIPDPSPRTVGPEVEADLVKVLKEKWIALNPTWLPAALQSHSREAMRWRLTLQAQSVKVESEPLQVLITWDGGWADDEKMMGDHLGISVVESGSK